MPVKGHDDPRFRGDGLLMGLGSYRRSALRDNKGSVRIYRAGPATGVPGVADGEYRSRYSLLLYIPSVPQQIPMLLVEEKHTTCPDPLLPGTKQRSRPRRSWTGSIA